MASDRMSDSRRGSGVYRIPPESDSIGRKSPVRGEYNAFFPETLLGDPSDFV